jgi:hypothetical protein
MITSLIPLTLIATLAVAQANEAPVVSDPTESVRRDTLRLQLTLRHGGPTCDEIDGQSPDPVGDLVWLMDNVHQPPWVGMRAADCLMNNHLTTETERVHTWVANPETKGLALLVLGRLDALPAPLAQSLAKAMLAGPHRSLIAPRLLESAHIELRAMVVSPTP